MYHSFRLLKGTHLKHENMAQHEMGHTSKQDQAGTALESPKNVRDGTQSVPESPLRDTSDPNGTRFGTLTGALALALEIVTLSGMHWQKIL